MLGEFAQTNILVVPVACKRLIHLSQDRTVIAVNTIQFLIGFGTQVRVTVLNTSHQLTAGEFPGFTIHFDLEDITVCDRII